MKGKIDSNINIEDKFFIDDEPIKNALLNANVRKIRDFLISLPYGKIYTTTKLAELLNIRRGTTETYLRNSALKNLHTIQVKGKTAYWGNEKSIQEFQRLINE